MAEPFVFHFRPDSSGHPEQMYIHDVLCGCGVCGHPQIQRFYHSTSFHSFDLYSLLRIASTAHEVADYVCENCGEQVGAKDVQRAVVRFAFADDAGEIVLFMRDFGVIDGPVICAQLFEQRRLDPQVQPVFEPDQAVKVLEEQDLTDDLVVERLGRYFSLKQALYELYCDWEDMDDPEDAFFVEKLAEGMWVVLGDDYENVLSDALNERELEEARKEDVVWLELLKTPAPELPFYEDTAHKLPGQWRRWMPVSTRETLEQGECAIWFGVSLSIIRESFERALEVARLQPVVDEDASVDLKSLVYEDIMTPRDEPMGQQLSLLDVAYRAVWTGISPGDAAQLSAEELVGMLLKVWHA